MPLSAAGREVADVPSKTGAPLKLNPAAGSGTAAAIAAQFILRQYRTCRTARCLERTAQDSLGAADFNFATVIALISAPLDLGSR
jgi:hypothetical protein